MTEQYYSNFPMGLLFVTVGKKALQKPSEEISKSWKGHSLSQIESNAETLIFCINVHMNKS